MKKLATFIILLITFGACEKEPVDLLIGGWKDIHGDLTRSFQEDGLYLWHVHYMADPNSGTGFYSINGDTLRIEENNSWLDTTYVSFYIFSVGKNELELINIETEDISNYERVKTRWLF